MGPRDWRVRPGEIIQAYAVPDHINLDGQTSFNPGNYNFNLFNRHIYQGGGEEKWATPLTTPFLPAGSPGCGGAFACGFGAVTSPSAPRTIVFGNEDRMLNRGSHRVPGLYDVVSCPGTVAAACLRGTHRGVTFCTGACHRGLPSSGHAITGVSR